MKSKSNTQLSGGALELSTAEKSCYPVSKIEHLTKKTDFNGNAFKNLNDVAIPCGLIADSIFNGKKKMKKKIK